MRKLLAFIACIFLLILVAAQAPRAETSPATWLERLNFYRATASLPPVEFDPALSGAVSQHARYMVNHDVVTHAEKPQYRWATPEGATAAASSNLAVSWSSTELDTWAVDVWMQTPFHALGILDPALRQVGFGIYRAENGKIQTAAGLDVLHGRLVPPPAVSYPIVWPADGSSVPLATGVVEYPNPLTSCNGYEAPTGLPLIVQIGAGQGTPHVTRSWMSDGDELLEHCVFDEGTYRNGEAEQERLGRSILGARDAIVLIPRKPLRPGGRYRTIIDVNERRIDWTFSVADPRVEPLYAQQ